MRYLFLLYGDEQAEAALPEDERREIVEAHGEFSGRMREAGRSISGAALDAGSTATVVRHAVDGGERIVTDGPFVEAKEQIGGLYLIECADLDEALRVAREIPYSPGLAIEIRPAPY